MPFAVYLLGLAVFAQGTSEFMLSGLLPDVAGDLGVSVPAAGALTSAFAVGMIVGAPVMGILGMRWPRRRALAAFLAAFIVAHAVGAVTTDFGVLLATRFLGAVADAGFLAVGLATATAMAGPKAEGRAASVLLGGITLACVVGVPVGALLGQWWGWRSAFWAVVLVSLPAVLAVLRSVPDSPREEETPGIRREWAALRRPRPLMTLLVAALVNGGTFCAFTYLAPVVTHVGGFGEGWVPVVLALFGLGSFAGVTIGGRVSDARPMALLVPGGLALAVGWALFALTAGNAAAALALVLVQGTLSFAVGSTLVAQVLRTAPEAPHLSGAAATCAFNVGAAAGPLLGGLTLGAGLGYRSPLGVSALLVAAACATGGTAYAVRRIRQHTQALA
ncbi:chloramphenicol efflux pump [Streptomyces griseocarneus]|nr:chloramphenicol efflux pump [Streptomyces griseocarneus]